MRAEIVVSARVDYRYLHRLVLKLLLSREHVEHRGNIILIELASVVRHNQASLSDGGGSDKDNLDAPRPIIFYRWWNSAPPL